MRKFFILTISFVLLATSAFSQSFQTLPSGVLVTLNPTHSNGKRLVQLEPVTADIIHVTATPAATMPKEESLITTPPKQYAPFTVSRKGDNVTLSTQKINATVSLKTGVVSFSDRNRNPILSEMADSSLFQPIQIDQDKGYTIQQVFEGMPHEAIYGLGQPSSATLIQSVSTNGMICPTVFSDALHIQGAGNDAYSIYNMSGCLMEQGKANSQTTIGENLQEGIYLLKLSGADGQHTLKIIKTR